MMSKTDIHYDVKKLIDTFVVPNLYLKAHEKKNYAFRKGHGATEKKDCALEKGHGVI